MTSNAPISSKEKLAYFKDNIQTADDQEDFDASQYYYNRDNVRPAAPGGPNASETGLASPLLMGMGVSSMGDAVHNADSSLTYGNSAFGSPTSVTGSFPAQQMAMATTSVSAVNGAVARSSAVANDRTASTSGSADGNQTLYQVDHAKVAQLSRSVSAPNSSVGQSGASTRSGDAYQGLSQALGQGQSGGLGNSQVLSNDLLVMLNKNMNLGPMGSQASTAGDVSRMGNGAPNGAPTTSAQMLGADTGEQVNFDMNEFPALASEVAGRLANLNISSNLSMPGGSDLDISRLNMQISEFAIQSEDFPALPGSEMDPLSLTSPMSALGSGDSIAHVMSNGISNDVMGLKSMEGSGMSGSVPARHLNRVGGESGTHMSLGDITASDDSSKQSRYGLLGLLNVIRMTDPDLNTLALGSDLTSLGLNLNSSKCLYATFASPWADGPSKTEPQYQLPLCYYMQQTPPLKHAHLQKFQLETLFHIFYAMPKDLLQAYAAQELYHRDWRYHMDLKLWFHRATAADGFPNQSQPQYLYFDINSWECRLFAGNIHGSLTAGLMNEEDVRVRVQPQN